MKIITHNGKFHADDVCCVAILEIINNEKVVVERTNKCPETWDRSNTIVVDLLGGDYDHHMPKENCPTYEDGTHYASFGQLCKAFKIDFGKQFAEIVKKIDNNDNGEGEEVNYISKAINSMNPPWNETMTDEHFMAAVELAKTLLNSVIKTSMAQAEADAIALQAINDSGESKIVVLPKYVPWQNIITAQTDKTVVVFESNRGGYVGQLIPVEPGSFETVAHFPKAWHGATKENLPSGINFCHASGFMIIGETIQDVVDAAKLAK